MGTSRKKRLADFKRHQPLVGLVLSDKKLCRDLWRQEKNCKNAKQTVKRLLQSVLRVKKVNRSLAPIFSAKQLGADLSRTFGSLSREDKFEAFWKSLSVYGDRIESTLRPIDDDSVSSILGKSSLSRGSTSVHTVRPRKASSAHSSHTPVSERQIIDISNSDGEHYANACGATQYRSKSSARSRMSMPPLEAVPVPRIGVKRGEAMKTTKKEHIAISGTSALSNIYRIHPSLVTKQKAVLILDGGGDLSLAIAAARLHSTAAWRIHAASTLSKATFDSRHPSGAGRVDTLLGKGHSVGFDVEPSEETTCGGFDIVVYNYPSQDLMPAVPNARAVCEFLRNVDARGREGARVYLGVALATREGKRTALYGEDIHALVSNAISQSSRLKLARINVDFFVKYRALGFVPSPNPSESTRKLWRHHQRVCYEIKVRNSKG